MVFSFAFFFLQPKKLVYCKYEIIFNSCAFGSSRTRATDLKILICLWAAVERKRPGLSGGASSGVYSHSVDLIESDNEFTPTHPNSF